MDSKNRLPSVGRILASSVSAITLAFSLNASTIAKHIESEIGKHSNPRRVNLDTNNPFNGKVVSGKVDPAEALVQFCENIDPTNDAASICPPGTR